MRACSMCINLIEGACRLGKPEKTKKGKPRRASHCRDFGEISQADLRILINQEVLKNASTS